MAYAYDNHDLDWTCFGQGHESTWHLSKNKQTNMGCAALILMDSILTCETVLINYSIHYFI